MRLVADMIRGMEVNKALSVLKFSAKELGKIRKIAKISYFDGKPKQSRKRIMQTYM